MFKIMLNCLIFVFILVLIYPKSIMHTVKRFLPYVLLGAAIVMISVVLQNTTNRTITITAFDQRNEQSEGGEIWLKSITIDGQKKEPQDVFSKGWIEEEGYLKWRSYDKIEGMSNSISASLDAEQDVTLEFDANIWRGKAEVKDGFQVKIVDCYKNTKNGSVALELGVQQWPIEIPGKVMFLAISAFLCVAAAGSVLIERIRNKSKLTTKCNTDTVLQEREIWLDVIKVISAFMICLIYTVGPAYQTLPIGSKGWDLVLFLNALPRFAVPVFMMVTGALALGKEVSFEKAKKNILHGIVLLFAWNIFYIFLNAILWGASEDIILQILALPVKRGPSGHLWYSYFIVWFYIFIPVLGIIYRAMNTKQRVYFFGITTLLPAVLDLYSKDLLKSSATVDAFSLTMILNYIGFLFIGRIIYDERKNILYKGLIGTIMSCSGLGEMIYFAYSYGIENNKTTDQYFIETGLFSVIFAVGVFLLSARIAETGTALPMPVKSIVVAVSKNLLGIYFIHCAVIWTLGDLQFGNIVILQNGTAGSVLCCCIVYFMISVIWVFLMDRIPVLRKLIR